MRFSLNYLGLLTALLAFKTSACVTFRGNRAIFNGRQNFITATIDDNGGLKCQMKTTIPADSTQNFWFLTCDPGYGATFVWDNNFNGNNFVYYDTPAEKGGMFQVPLIETLPGQVQPDPPNGPFYDAVVILYEALVWGC